MTAINKPRKPLQLPCLHPLGTRFFTPTADQRFLTGTREFLRTHFPIQLRSYRAGSERILTEQDLLQSLLKTNTHISGNRVIILYGAAGSGKSELLRWLQTQITLQNTARAEVALRISRTELDIFHIVQRFHSLYKGEPFQAATMQRWEECRQKPRTLAKILVLTALEQLLDSDEQINAIYYQLIDIVQTNLEQCFAAISQPSEDTEPFIELFSRENLAEILHDSVIPIPLEYETLRYYLLKVFRDQLLEGLDLPSTLKKIAFHIQQTRQQRPILFIDDLVQSINLFATDLLDYFITLEEGCWDVIIGITPNSLESSQRGKELLERITYLDTIDDRVLKLWLSDEYGHISSFLNEANCAEYARMYLREFKQQNQQPCDPSCSAFQQCQQLEPEQATDLLAPFNKELLIRLFRSLPQQKGKLRYFTIYLRDILERISQGEDILSVLQDYIQPEHAVYHPDKQLSQIYELYGPLSQSATVQESNSDLFSLHRFFDLPQETLERPVTAALYKSVEAAQSTPSISDAQFILDPEKEAIKNWLQGATVNKQLLRNMRRGIVKAIKDGYLLDTMTRLYIAKPTRILHWTQTRMETTPPVQLEGIDDFDGIPVQRTLGPLAYLLHDFADASGDQEQHLRHQILEHSAFPTILYQGMIYRMRIRNELEQQVGMTIEELAFSLFLFAAKLGYHSVQLPPSIQTKIGGERFPTPKYPESIEAKRPHLTNSHLSMIRRLFDDCFKLRENVYDGSLLDKLAEQIHSERAVNLLQSIPVDVLAQDFRLNDAPLSILLGDIQQMIHIFIQMRSDPKVKNALLSVYRVELGTDDASQQLATLVGTSTTNDDMLRSFLQDCPLVDLHRALILAYEVGRKQYEELLTQLRHKLAEVETNVEPESYNMKATNLTSHFTREEINVLVQFTHQNARILLNGVGLSFLRKVANHLPGLYEQLELRLQRG